MITNADITVYNQKLNPETKLIEYKRTQIENVNWYSKQEVSVGDKGLNSADSYKIRIPEESPASTYVNEKEYSKLENVSGHWTLKNGDKIVRGLVDDDIAKGSDLGKYAEVCTVVSYSDNRRGLLPHWRVGGA